MTDREPPRVTVVIPAYNEEGRVGKVVREALRHADEVIVVDDGSRDNTRDEAAKAGAKVVSNRFGKGYIGAIKTGFHNASGEIVVTMDADGEHDPADIPKLIAPIIEGRADLVLGRRSRIPRPSERLLNWLTRLRVPTVRDTGTGFRALRADLARELRLRGRCTCGIFVLEAFLHGAKISEVTVNDRAPLTPKRRRIMWEHVPQLFYVLGLLLRTLRRHPGDKGDRNFSREP